MLNVVAVKDGQLDSTANAIVGTQCGAFGCEPFAINVGANGIGVKVEVYVDKLVAHHVHVTLKNHRLAILHAFGGRLANNHVAGFVYAGVKSTALAPVLQIVNHLLFML